MGIERKVVAGHWSDERVQKRVADWMRTAVGLVESRNVRILRVADNMRNVAVTEGDKVEAQIKLGWTVDAYPVNEIAEYVAAVSQADTDALVDEYYNMYDILLDGRDEKEFRRHVAVQAQIELGFERFMVEKDYHAIVTHLAIWARSSSCRAWPSSAWRRRATASAPRATGRPPAWCA